ncbi:cyclic nucleotide-gated cation channel alpha-4-like [Austrofundulus limnaeus]|uniref:Cyclic nucleotide-gated cation channel alpha-4-like n=1 Tax=Austrofundulus limnaeus TaxID=52670 RepID=A0A2I4C680_AUSLI|nr:PREDICTED: cyclic nucleotide-gated cation channel alpha-4-like [Austrofundulus limnaeus]
MSAQATWSSNPAALLNRPSDTTVTELESFWFWLFFFPVFFPFSGFLDQGILIKDLTRLRKHYLHSKHFVWDLASLLPTDFLYFAFGVETPLVRINRLMRIPRLSEALDRMETRTSYPNTFRITKLMIYIFVLIHWNSCLYFALSSHLGFGSDPWVYPNITDPEFASMRRQYFYCFWFSAEIFTTVGDTPLPEREEEYLFMVADLLIAVLVFASIVGNVGNIITSMRNRDNVFFPNHELVNHVHKHTEKLSNWVVGLLMRVSDSGGFHLDTCLV